MAYISRRCKKDRDEIVKELMKYIPVHSIGKCLNNADSKVLFPECVDLGRYTSNWQKAKDCIVSKFMFYLAFENSVYNNYVTEKLLSTLRTGTVPIYSGAPNAMDFAPGNHSFINLNDYPSMYDLAQHIKNVSSQPEVYKQYFDWQKKPRLEKFSQLRKQGFGTAILRLCEFLAKDD